MTGILIPFYVYPSLAWKEVARAQRAYPYNPIIAVINPASGPGQKPDQNYVDGIKYLQEAGVKVLGYVATTYAEKDVGAVADEINYYKIWYDVDGTFFDEVASSGQETYYETVAQEARPKFTIGNAGVVIPNTYVGIMDNFVVYEASGWPNITLPKDFDPKNFSIVAHSLTAFPQTQIVALPEDSFGYIYVTNLTEPNPYSAVPWLWETLSALFIRSRGVK